MFKHRGSGLRMLIASCVVAALLFGGWIAGTAAPRPSKIVMSSAGGSYDKCLKKVYVTDWERQTGIKVEFGGTYYDMGSWKAQQQTGKVEWDVTSLDSAQAAELARNGWLAPIDESIIVKNGGLVDLPDMTLTRGGKLYGVSAELGTYPITYNTDKFGATPPQSWADVFNVSKYPGKRTFSKNPADFMVLEAALLADGVPKNKLYPLDVERALRKLDTIKSQILWYESGAQQVALFQQGEAVIGLGWEGRIKQLKREGGRVELTAQDAFVRTDYFAIPRGAPHGVELANRYIAFITSPREQAKFTVCFGSEPGWKEAYKYLPKTGLDLLITDPRDLSKLVVWNLAYWDKNRRTVTDRFNKWLTQ